MDRQQHRFNCSIFSENLIKYNSRCKRVLKNASPVVKLFADKIEPNDEAAEQPLSFEKPGIGHYLVKGSSGFAKEGWWIEIPTDTHGNKICAVEYQTLENGDLEIKTYKKK